MEGLPTAEFYVLWRDVSGSTKHALQHEDEMKKRVARLGILCSLLLSTHPHVLQHVLQHVCVAKPFVCSLYIFR
jgi:hypothetical protein